MMPFLRLPRCVVVIAMTAMCLAAWAGAVSEPTFHVSFDGDSPVAVSSVGPREPVRAVGVGYADGLSGRAARFCSGSLLEYPASGSLNARTCSVAAWVKREWKGTNPARRANGDYAYRTLFATPKTDDPKRDAGTGALWMWWFGLDPRADVASDGRGFCKLIHEFVPPTGRWEHIVYVWTGNDFRIYLDGARRDKATIYDCQEPSGFVGRQPRQLTFSRRAEPNTFFVGSLGGHHAFEGLVDDLSIYDVPLTDEDVAALFAHGARNLPPSHDRAQELARLLNHDNSWSTAPSRIIGLPDGLEKVDEVRFDEVGVDALRRSDRFSMVGEGRFGEHGGCAYLQTGSRVDDRFAVRFRLDPKSPLYVFEFEHPDCGLELGDVLIQRSKNPRQTAQMSFDYAMQVGWMTGGEFPNTGNMVTNRCVYWNATDDVAVLVSNVRTNQAPRLSAVRVYRVTDAKLPRAPVNDATICPADRRTFALHYEDPAMGCDFATFRTDGRDDDELDLMLGRLMATMKFTGQNLLVYPATWYAGPIDSRHLNPRGHAEGYLTAIFTAFDREELGFMPSLHQYASWDADDRQVTPEALADGSIHATALSVQADGGIYKHTPHSGPPAYNILHPTVRHEVLAQVDDIIRTGLPHSSFKGICLHLHACEMLWFGLIGGGYNDYCVEAFEQATGVRVPVDRTNPRRGRLYADWLLANVREKWIQWRCDALTAFYGEIADRLKSARPDLKLRVVSFLGWSGESIRTRNFRDPRWLETLTREAGLDAAALARRADNIELGQTTMVAAGRHFWDWWGVPDAKPFLSALPESAQVSMLPKATVRSVVHQHDIYWESGVGFYNRGKSGLTLETPWLDDNYWRVTTLNPSGFYARKPYVDALRHADVTDLSKGGFLVGTYGTETEILPFVCAFRSLPAVKFGDERNDGAIVVRATTYGGRRWKYVLNLRETPVHCMLKFAGQFVDLVSNERFVDQAGLELAPYSLRAFASESGADAQKKNLLKSLQETVGI